MSTLTEMKCPCCAGAVEFNPGTQNIKCPYCDTEFDIEALKKAQQEEQDFGDDSFTWKSGGAQWQPDEVGGMGIYTCKSCGGEIVADENTGATTCPYCDSPVVMTGQFTGGLRPELIIPFRYDKKAAKEALIKHISSKKMVPKIFKDQNHIDEIKGIYVPYWLYSGTAEASADFSAQKVRTWSDRDNNYVETSYYSCWRSGNMGFADIPVDGSSKMDDALMESVEPFDVSEGVDFDTAYMAGYLADKYDIDADTSMPRANERVKNSIIAALERSVHERAYTSVVPRGSQVNIEDGSYKYALYPVWVLNTTWEGKKYTFAMNGQTGKFVGDLPLDKRAFRKRVAAFTAPVSALVYLALWFIGNM